MELIVLGAFPSSLLFTKKNEGRFPPFDLNINDLAAHTSFQVSEGAWPL